MLDFFSEYLSDLNEWGPIFTLWSNSEDRVSHALAAVAKSVEKCFLALQELVCDISPFYLVHMYLITFILLMAVHR